MTNVDEFISNAMMLKYRLQVQNLLKVPKIQQKTEEWYKARNNLITASDFAQALGEGKFGTQKQLIEKKVRPDENSGSFKNQFFEWGNLFEPVACNVYSAMHGGITVHEFGLIQHPTRPYFGASPDGITDEGVMLEIKCPLKRKISGDIPTQYYYQIQGQLDVCNLDHCDYFECEFTKFDNYDEYLQAVDPQCYSGVIIKGELGYEYPETVIGKPCTNYGRFAVYWTLNKYNKKRVVRDEKFVNAKLDELKHVWDKILYYRNNPELYTLEVKKEITIDTEAAKLKGKCIIVDLE